MPLMTRRLTLGVMLASVALATLWAQATDPRIGTWTLNKEKSTYVPDRPGPQRVTRTYEDLGGGRVRWTMETVDAKGETFHEEVTFTLDGKDYPRVVQKGTVVSQTLADADTVKGVAKQDGKVIGSFTMTVSKDRKTMTYQSKGTDEKGQKWEVNQVFDRVK